MNNLSSKIKRFPEFWNEWSVDSDRISENMVVWSNLSCNEYAFADIQYSGEAGILTFLCSSLPDHEFLGLQLLGIGNLLRALITKYWLCIIFVFGVSINIFVIIAIFTIFLAACTTTTINVNIWYLWAFSNKILFTEWSTGGWWGNAIS